VAYAPEITECGTGSCIYDIHTEGGVRFRWTNADGERVSSMWTSTQKIWTHWHHPVFFSCKEVGIFTRISSSDEI